MVRATHRRLLHLWAFVAEYVRKNFGFDASRRHDSLCGAGSGDAGAIFESDGERFGLPYTVSVCTLEHAHAPVPGRAGLGNARIHKDAVSRIKLPDKTMED